MRYHLENGKPVLTSAGADSMFTFNPDKSGNYKGTPYADASADNIRSDQR